MPLVRHLRFAAALSVLAGTAVGAQSQPAAPNTAYRAGSTVQSAATGITFTVPASFQGAWDDDASGIVLQDGAGTMIGVWGISDGTIEGVADEVGSILTGLGLQIAPLSAPVESNGITTATFRVQSQGGMGYLAAALRKGPSGAVIAVAALGEDQGTLPALSEEVARGAQFGTAQATQWRTRAAGLRFQGRSGDSNFSRGGVGDGSYSSRSTYTLVLCRSGQYQWQSQSRSFFSLDGMSGSSSAENTSSDGHQGTWMLVGDLVGRAFLVLDSSDDRYFVWSVEENSSGVAINGSQYQAEAGPC